MNLSRSMARTPGCSEASIRPLRLIFGFDLGLLLLDFLTSRLGRLDRRAAFPSEVHLFLIEVVNQTLQPRVVSGVGELQPFLRSSEKQLLSSGVGGRTREFHAFGRRLAA